MSSLDLAKELNKAIVNSKEYIELKEAEEKVLASSKSEILLKDFIDKQKYLQDMQKNSNEDHNDIIKKIRLELMNLYNSVEANPDIRLLIESLDRFINYKKNIMKIIDSDISLSSDVYMLKAKKSCNKTCGGCK